MPRDAPPRKGSILEPTQTPSQIDRLDGGRRDRTRIRLGRDAQAHESTERVANDRARRLDMRELASEPAGLHRVVQRAELLLHRFERMRVLAEALGLHLAEELERVAQVLHADAHAMRELDRA